MSDLKAFWPPRETVKQLGYIILIFQKEKNGYIGTIISQMFLAMFTKPSLPKPSLAHVKAGDHTLTLARL